MVSGEFVHLCKIVSQKNCRPSDVISSEFYSLVATTLWTHICAWWEAMLRAVTLPLIFLFEIKPLWAYMRG